MKTFFFTILISLTLICFLSVKSTEAKVLFEQSKIGVPYDLYLDVGAGYGLYSKFPQYNGEPPIFPGGGIVYDGTAEWLRVKRMSGVNCEAPNNISLFATDGATQIGFVGAGISNGPYCDFPITGPNRTNMALGYIGFCVNGGCNNQTGGIVLDGSPDNDGYVIDGTQTISEKGGWAFQICDIDGCSGGFEGPTTTATTTATSTATTTLGASSVLFLPGIMGSRLYEVGQQCGDFGEEQQRWFSTTDCKQLRLQTGSTGDSLNDIYTKEGASSVIDETLGFNLYKSFFNELADWKEEEIIKDYALVPYDWRMRLDYLLKTKKDSSGKIKYDPNSQVTDSYLYKTLKDLAENSKTGKVTIVAHSNGGLLAKTLLATLQKTNDPLLAKIDNVILVGAPQLGTPSTLLGMLHGDEIGPSGFVVSQQTTRILMNTMPFAFHLLPNASYFNSSGVTVDTPIIRFEGGTSTTPWVNTFGSSINNAGSLKTFLTGDSGRIKPAITDLVKPEIVPKYLFDNYTDGIDQLMNLWTPPITMNVYQIAGIGLPTQSGITYFTDRECISRDVFKLFKCTAYKNKLGFRVNDTVDGDETVVTPSALAMSNSQDNVQRWWLNLKNYNEFNFDRRHKDILEVEDVINFIKNTITLNPSVTYEYLSDLAPALPNENRLVFDLHSPLDLSVVTTDGGIVSSSTNTVDGAIYKRFGELQHISIPNTSAKKTVRLNGQATGSFTLEIGEQTGVTIIKRHTYSAIPSSTSTKVTLELETNKPVELASLTVDYDGNGTTEIVYNTNGEVIPEITYTTLRTTINSFNIKSPYKNLLLENVKIAEQYNQKPKLKSLERVALEVLKQQVILYEKLKVLTPAQKQQLIEIINKLLSK